MSTPHRFTSLLSSHRPNLSPYEALYKHFHANPELSDQEVETAALITSELRKLSPDLDIRTGIGGHGLVAILENGPGPVVMLRADMDALPVVERTGVEWASVKKVKDGEGHERGVMRKFDVRFSLVRVRFRRGRVFR
jgi:metal-dependent amidase/aminoacylase/carboxypeptidase family protein